MERLKIYATITETLKMLLEKQLQPAAPSSAVPNQPGPPPAKPEEQETPDPQKEVTYIILTGNDLIVLSLNSLQPSLPPSLHCPFSLMIW